MLLALAKGLGMHHHLMLAVDRRHAGIALNDAMTGFHLGAFVVGDIAFDFTATDAGARFLGIQEAFELARDLAQFLDLLLFTFVDVGLLLGSILLVVALQHAPYGSVNFLFLFLEFGVGAAPFL